MAWIPVVVLIFHHSILIQACSLGVVGLLTFFEPVWPKFHSLSSKAQISPLTIHHFQAPNPYT